MTKKFFRSGFMLINEDAVQAAMLDKKGYKLTLWINGTTMDITENSREIWLYLSRKAIRLTDIDDKKPTEVVTRADLR